MKYNMNEYITAVDRSDAEKEQELAVASKIMSLLNQNNYDSLDRFLEANADYEGFLYKHNMDNVVKHFGRTLTQEDYDKIINSLKQLTNDKSDFDREGIKTTKIEEKEIVTYEGTDNTKFLDNSHNPDAVETQMEHLQPTSTEFQTGDKKVNTENMMDELADSKKETLNPMPLEEINRDVLTEKEIAMFNAAASYQLDKGGTIKLDIGKGIIIDSENNVLSIEEQDGNFVIIDEKNHKQEIENPQLVKIPPKPVVEEEAA